MRISGRTVITLALLIVPTFAAAPSAGGGSCIAYGDVWAFMLSPAPGWVLSCEPGEQEGVPVALWPKGSTWSNAKVVMYVNTSDKSDPRETLESFVEYSATKFREDKPGVVIKPGKPLKTADGRTAIVQDFTGDPWGNFESVAYVDSKTIFAMIVFSARNEKEFKSNHVAFEKVVASYGYMDKVEK